MGCKFYRAVIKATGTILESETFKNVYRCALLEGKNFMRHNSDDIDAIIIELEEVTYSDELYMNMFGYLQHDIIDHRHIAFLAVGAVGYTVDYRDGTLEVERECI